MDGGGNGADGFLGVARSVTGRRWRGRLGDERLAHGLAQRAGLSDLVARVVAARGIGLEEVDDFLEPTLRATLPDPSRLRDMDRAVERTIRAVEGGERIGVLADYDVDGATSAALLVRYFARLGRTLDVYVPDRLREGYGPNAAALAALRKAGASLVLTVDCGTTAHGPLTEAAALGLDVIVLDHHVSEPALPPAAAVVNPNRLDEDNDCRQLAAVGVTFLFLVALNRKLREAGWYGQGHAAPELLEWLDLVALGTVCDVVPLTGVNRALTAQGLKVMARRGNPGIAALADVAGIDERPTAYHAGFVIGPRVNAGGRLGDSGLGVRLLTTGSAEEATQLAGRLDACNRERREVETAVLEDARARAELALTGADPAVAPLLLLAGEGWHPGVIGIVASRIKDACNLPVCVVALDGELGKGSGRSVRGVALGPAVIAARQAGLLIDGGGHEMAAGFTVAADRVSALAEFLNQHIARQLDHRAPVVALGIDGALAPAGATAEVVAALESLGPFGAGNPRPRFALPGVRIHRADVVGNDHVRCILGGGGPERLKGIAFRSAQGALGQALLAHTGPLHVAGHLRTDAWRGPDAVELVIEDAARP